jgi:hypothetical protein
VNEDLTFSSPQATPPKRFCFKRLATLILALLLLYLVGAYLVVPAMWIGYAHRHPAFDDVPRLTHTGDDHPGGPINVALIGTESQLKRILLAPNGIPPTR